MPTEYNWEMLKSIIHLIGIVFGLALWGLFLYYLIISMFAWVKRKEVPCHSFAPVNRFAVIIAAHNEQAVIANIVRNLMQISYPRHMYDIFVVADNCTDSTAKIAAENGAKVYERFDNEKRGKGHTLEWMFKRLFEIDEQYDAVCVLDADNLVSPNFLMEMNKHLCLGHEVVQGYLDSKNPTDSWISGNNSIAFWISNRLIQLPRYYLGLSCILGGTGFIISTRILKELGWGATCLAEDLEFSLKLVLKGKKVYWSHDAVIYDEKPLTIAQSWRQRKRWMQGHFDCSARFLKNLLLKGIKEKNMIPLDCALYLVQPLIVVVNGVGMVLGLGSTIFNAFNDGYSLSTILVTVVMFAFMYLSIMFVIIEGKASVKILKYILLVPIYNLTWVPIIIQGFLDKDKKEWVHTLHTRSLDIDEVEPLEKVS